jgi:putative radical SAM enzyme (TIGR03279 family)
MVQGTQANDGIMIQSVTQGSIAEQVGIVAGDRVLAVGNRVVEDILDFDFHRSQHETELCLKVAKATGEVWEIEIEKSPEEGLGIELEGIQTRICGNNCIFCFVHQLPRGKHIRRTLRVKDEDFRLSFLYGHYLTLTNLSEHDFQRILEQHLSPLYVSVHATEPELRTFLLQNRKPDNLLGNMRRLVDGGIKLHTQIVLIPGINDEAHLERSLNDLIQFYPNVMSVSIVPVGLTDHRKGLTPLKAVDTGYARKTIDHIAPIQEHNRVKYGTPFCFLGDEFYILAGHPIPPRSHYGDFPLVENGVGMIRNFLDEFEAVMRTRWNPVAPLTRATVLTGHIFHPTLQACVERLNNRFGLDLKCYPAENRFLGKGITVAGLLSGGDLFAAVKNRLHGDFLVIPSECMIGQEGLFLDNWTRSDLEVRLGVPVFGGGYHVEEFFKLLFSRKAGPSRDRGDSLDSSSESGLKSR